VVTQQDLAKEFGSSREVITTQIQEFKRQGWVELGRGYVELMDSAALVELSAK